MAGSIASITGSPPLEELELLDELEELEDEELEDEELEELEDEELDDDELELEELDELELEELPPGPPQADKIATELANSVVAKTREPRHHRFLDSMVYSIADQ